jgi:GT2 family glycosyltransferase
MGKTPLVVVVILTWNQKDFTLNCLESLELCSYENLEVVVVDNNSDDQTAEAVRFAYPHVHLVESTVNAGVAGGRNLGLQFAEETLSYDYLLILDNDTTVDRNFLQPMVDVLEMDKRVGVVSPKIYLMGEDNVLDQAGGSIVNFFTGSTAKRGYGEYDRGQYDADQQQNCLPSGACSLSRRSVIVACNGLDDIFNPYGFEDLDYSLRVKQAGYRLAYSPQARVYHKGNKTGFNSYTESYASIKGRHLRLFMKRHATPFQLICFNMFLPVLGLRTLLREARKGNVKAVIKLFQAYVRN